MLSKSHKEILIKILANIDNNENKILLDDYIALHNVVMALYARNLFCSHGNWQKIKRLYSFNYGYMRKNSTSYKLTDIEKRLRNYCNIFIKNINNFNLYHDEFIDFIKESMYQMIHYIIVPIKIMSSKINIIIDKYKNFTYTKKSKLINYEVLSQLGIDINI
jgi:hypothetical protein